MKTHVYGISKKTGDLTICRARNPETCPYHAKDSHKEMTANDAIKYQEQLARPQHTAVINGLKKRPAIRKPTASTPVLNQTQEQVIHEAPVMAAQLLNEFRNSQNYLTSSRQWMDSPAGQQHVIGTMMKYNQLIDQGTTPNGVQDRIVKLQVNQPDNGMYEVKVDLDRPVNGINDIINTNQEEFIRTYISNEATHDWNTPQDDDSQGQATFTPTSELTLKSRIVSNGRLSLVYTGPMERPHDGDLGGTKAH